MSGFLWNLSAHKETQHGQELSNQDHVSGRLRSPPYKTCRNQGKYGQMGGVSDDATLSSLLEYAI